MYDSLSRQDVSENQAIWNRFTSLKWAELLSFACLVMTIETTDCRRLSYDGRFTMYLRIWP